MRRGLPVGVMIACGLAVLAAFLPWATVSAYLPPSMLDPVAAIGHTTGAKLAELTGLKLGPFTLTYTGWDGSTSVFGSGIPAWLAPAAALFVAGLMLLRLAPDTRVPGWLPLAFCACGIGHLAVFGLLILHPAPKSTGSLDVGWYVALFAFILMLRSLIRDRALTLPDTPNPAPQRAPV